MFEILLYVIITLIFFRLAPFMTVGVLCVCVGGIFLFILGTISIILGIFHMLFKLFLKD